MAPPTSPIPATLLTLRLSSPSFLETILTTHGCPVYSTETYGSTTSLSRCDPAHGLTLIANIHWPDRHSRLAAPPADRCAKGKARQSSPSASSGARLFIDGSTVSEEDLLKRNRLNTSRKFRIPGHSHSLKWRRVQGVFQCTTSAGAPVAVFEPAIITAPARLNVFVATLSGLPAPPPQVQADGISATLVDYLLVTALLLLIHPEDWHGFSAAPRPAPAPPARTALPHLDIPASHPDARPRAQHTPETRGAASGSTPVSPITSAVSERSFPFSPCSSSDTLSQCWDPERPPAAPYPSCVNACVHADRELAAESKEAAEYEPPPPYEEIQWTVRVRQPRRLRP